jgi:hypothetical protein
MGGENSLGDQVQTCVLSISARGSRLQRGGAPSGATLGNHGKKEKEKEKEKDNAWWAPAGAARPVQEG